MTTCSLYLNIDVAQLMDSLKAKVSHGVPTPRQEAWKRRRKRTMELDSKEQHLAAPGRSLRPISGRSLRPLQHTRVFTESPASPMGHS